jgi:tRNA threonylcarbamoyladenosine biosynthesis protein TsaB
MKILALEFSSAQRSAALWEDGGTAAAPALLGSALDPPPPRLPNSQLPIRNPQSAIRNPQFPSQRSLGLAEQALAEARCAREDIGALAVGLGPGSYTGIRGAIALAQGWQLGRGVGLLGVSSVECLAAQARAEGRRGAVHIIIDAQREEFYLARYQIADAGWSEVEALRLASRPEIQALAAKGATLLGPDIARWFAGARDLWPSAVMLGRLACGRRDFVPGENLEPIYLRETAFKKAPPPRQNL